MAQTDTEQPFLQHLFELRDRLLRIVIVVGLIFVVLLYFSTTLYSLLATPLLKQLPGQMIATGTISPVLVPLKLTLMLSVFVGIPFILYQMWAFIAPGLYKHEKRLVMPLVISSTLLFYLGMAFAYFVVFPLIFAFTVAMAPEGVDVMTDMADYLDFVLTLFFAFGVAFEVPIATIILIWTGVTSRETLANIRPYFIVGAFLIGMLMTPPDIISQVLLALPVWGLFEVGLFASRFFVPKDSSDQAETDTPDDKTASDQYPDDYEEPTDEELEAELDRMEQEENEEDATNNEEDEDTEDDYTEDEEDDEDESAVIDDVIESQLKRVMALRNTGDIKGARELLYQILEQGNADQRNVARDILKQLDEDED